MIVWHALPPGSYERCVGIGEVVDATTAWLDDRADALCCPREPMSPLTLAVDPASLERGHRSPRVFRMDASAELKPARLRKGSHAYVRLPGETWLRASTACAAFGSAAGHLVLSQGAPVLYAGEIDVDDDGGLVRWSNKSGSYRPAPWAATAIALPMSCFVPHQSSGSRSPSLDDAFDDPPVASTPMDALFDSWPGTRRASLRLSRATCMQSISPSTRGGLAGVLTHEAEPHVCDHQPLYAAPSPTPRARVPYAAPRPSMAEISSTLGCGRRHGEAPSPERDSTRISC
ncbi:hypothetical protein KFE25_013807 [Diacronema lutheri]|uniref:Uncharacterized protein n=1 Tax=Diacronema lutheri TaxID=2081491 RepID=A0A8J5XZB4_DIALT|nr:hypothetical protein KFE25_013807 [Diacronema lutheri]|mmetsp:Transcript_3451/g.10785  ORF Transcript_3451/g.10785 Transcript_3451/m.10785 type:complete len:288 (-) Transcript_3451:90-953(-)